MTPRNGGTRMNPKDASEFPLWEKNIRASKKRRRKNAVGKHRGDNLPGRYAQADESLPRTRQTALGDGRQRAEDKRNTGGLLFPYSGTFRRRAGFDRRNRKGHELRKSADTQIHGRL